MSTTRKRQKATTIIKFVVQYLVDGKWVFYISWDTIEEARDHRDVAKKKHKQHRWRIVKRTTKDEVVE